MKLAASQRVDGRWQRWVLARLNTRYGLIILAPVPVLYLLFGLYWSEHSALQADFTGYYTAATIAVRGLGAHLYDLDLQRQVQSEIIFPHRFEVGGVLPFQYPPFAVLPFLPLAWLPIRTAYYLWGALNLGFFVAALALLSRSIPELEKAPRVRAFLWLASFSLLPFLSALMLGQLSFLVLLSYVAGFTLLLRGREVEAGVVLAVAAVKPQLMIVVPLLLLSKARWGVLAGMAVGLGCLFGLSLLLVGPFDPVQFLSINRETAEWLPATLNLTLFGFFSGLLQPWPAAIVPATGGTEVLILLLLWRSWGGTWRPDSSLFRLKLALLLLASMTLAPHLYAHDLVLLVPVAFFVVGYLVAEGVDGRGLMLARLMAGAVFTAALVDSYPLLDLPVRPLFLAMVATGGAVLLVVMKENGRGNLPRPSMATMRSTSPRPPEVGGSRPGPP